MYYNSKIYLRSSQPEYFLIFSVPPPPAPKKKVAVVFGLRLHLPSLKYRLCLHIITVPINSSTDIVCYTAVLRCHVSDINIHVRTVQRDTEARSDLCLLICPLSSYGRNSSNATNCCEGKNVPLWSHICFCTL